jgi:hypothetical protein
MSRPTRKQMIDGLRILATQTPVTATWFIGAGWDGNAADLLDAAAEELEDRERQPLTGSHGFVRQQQSPTYCLLIVTRAEQGPVLCNLPPEHPIHQGRDV